ncbi:hypothetical protein ACSVDM_00960 [Nocardia sp. JW2]|uniref:hypothetical protein n=1 Tax=Nocardia sp. JW2 TaxID=3450738 RepID=UPI003F41D5E9
MLAELVRQCRVPVVMDGPAQVWLHPVSAWVVVAAVREALTNVERHASASRVRIALEESRIVVFDNGVGLTGRSDGVNVRHGIRRSIVERMSSIGGSALVTGVAGSGTSVELRWPPDGPVHTPEEPENDTGGVPHLETGLTIAIAGVSIADIGWQLTRLAEHPDPIPAPWVHLLLAIVTVGCATTAIVATNRRAMTTVALMTTVIAISVVLTAWIPESHSGLNWTIGAAGWAVVALGIRGSRETTVAALLVWWIVVCVVVVIDAPTLGMVAHMVYLTVGILYLQIAIVMFASSLHRVVELVASRERQRREVVASHAVETALNQECEQRYRRQLASLLPILRGIADGTVSPKSPEVRSRAQAEYSRLRRLLARVDSMDYPLFADIRDAVDDAEARGVQVVIDAPPDLPELSAGDRDLVAASIRIMLDGSRLRARLTVMAEQDAIDVSVICDIGSTVLERLSDLWSTTDMALTIVDEEAGTVWLRLRCEVSSDQFTTRTDSSIAAASA